MYTLLFISPTTTTPKQAVLRYMTHTDFRVLMAIELGSRNHEFIPTVMICRLSGMKSTTATKIINTLHKNKLIRHEQKMYDGYKLTYLGYDYLALHTFVARGTIVGLGRRIGVGKESDVYECINADNEIQIIKIHRLGRVSFRNIKNLRDYHRHRHFASWLYLSRLAALREYSFMKALYDHGFNVPIPLDVNRHCILMNKINGYPLSQVSSLRSPGRYVNECSCCNTNINFQRLLTQSHTHLCLFSFILFSFIIFQSIFKSYQFSHSSCRTRSHSL